MREEAARRGAAFLLVMQDRRRRERIAGEGSEPTAARCIRGGKRHQENILSPDSDHNLSVRVRWSIKLLLGVSRNLQPAMLSL